ncbi:MAG: CapA family protein [Chitinispirillaceae bacterium]|nr:CapA family protein [Chitinispirillaceae bacterium]
MPSILKKNPVKKAIITIYVILLPLFSTFAQQKSPQKVSSSRNTVKAKQMVNLAIPYLKTKNTLKALPYLDSAVIADSSYIPALWEAGWAYYLTENWQNVYTLWNRIKILNPKMPDLAINLRMAEDRLAAQKLIDTLEHFSSKQIDTLPSGARTIDVVAVGDIQMGRAWPVEHAALPPNGPLSIFKNVNTHLKADITFGNLETVLSNSGGSMKAQKKGGGIFIFRVPTSYSKALAEVGFSVLSTANNHANDFKTHGIYQTMGALDSSGILHSGRTGKIAFWEKNGLKICMVAYSTQEAAFVIQNTDNVKKLIHHLDKSNDIVIVSFHGGAEGNNALKIRDTVEFYHGENRGNSFQFARTAVDAGADLVLGHGPHVLRAMEIYKGRLIAYSLGNFCSYKSFSTEGSLKYSAILRVQLASNGVCTKAAVTPLVFDSDGVPMIDTQKNAVSLLNQLSSEAFRQTAVQFDSTGNFCRIKNN